MTPTQVLSILWRRWWILALAFVSTMAGAGGILLLVSPRYDAVATASLDPGQVDPVTGQSGSSMLLRVVQGNLLALVQSHRVAAEVVRRLNLTRDPALISLYLSSGSRERMDIAEWIASEFLIKNLDARFPEGSNILSIKYKTNSPTQAALIANTFQSVFVDTALEMKTTAAQQTARWFEPQMEKMQADLKLARERLTQFQREAKLLAAGMGNDSESNQLIAVTNELSNAKAQLLLLQSQVNIANSEVAAGKTAALLPDSPTLTSIKASLATVTAEIGKQQGEIGINNPKLRGLLATRQSLLDQIGVEIVARGKALRDQIQFLEQARSEQVQRMISVQAQRDQLMGLQREVDFRQSEVDSASKLAGTARLQSRLSFSTISTLDSATPPTSPAFPKVMIVIPLGIGAGLALGVILALLAEAFDRRIRVPSDLDFAASAPVLGTLLNSSPRRRLLGGPRMAAVTAQRLRGPTAWIGRTALRALGSNRSRSR